VKRIRGIAEVLKMKRSSIIEERTMWKKIERFERRNFVRFVRRKQRSS
jgi:hypothetical protein